MEIINDYWECKLPSVHFSLVATPVCIYILGVVINKLVRKFFSY